MKTPALLLAALTVTLSAQAKIITQPVAYEHAGTKLEGYLAYDDEKTAKGKLPGVIVVPEWWGLNDYSKGRAEAVAKLGYVAFAIDMYGAGISTTEPKKAGELAAPFYGQPLMAERAQAGLDQLLKTGLVDETRVAAIGYCFGGSVVQALAYTGAPLAGIVSFHGGLIPVPADAAAKTKAKILICHGAIDPTISKEALDGFLKSMDEGKFDYQFISYAGAMHAFTNPNADKIRADKGLNMIAYNKAADKRSWAHMRAFFNEIFAPAKEAAAGKKEG
jgi:dienelactone hydrolase